jgi:hypothetical protein
VQMPVLVASALAPCVSRSCTRTQPRTPVAVLISGIEDKGVLAQVIVRDKDDQDARFDRALMYIEVGESKKVRPPTIPALRKNEAVLGMEFGGMTVRVFASYSCSYVREMMIVGTAVKGGWHRGSGGS